MNTINIDPSKFTGTHPKEEGVFLWKNSQGFELIKVVLVPEKGQYGMHWDSYYAVAGHRGRNVTHLLGEFLKVSFNAIS